MKKNNIKTVQVDKISTGELYLNENKSKKIIKDMNKELVNLEKSWMNLSVSFSKLVNLNVVKGKHGESIKNLVKQSKIQSAAAKKLNSTLSLKLEEDLKNYPIQLLDKRISLLEEKVNRMTEE